jgi:hypothetical protein
VPYVPPFDVIKDAANISAVKGELRVTLSYDDFVKLVKQLLTGFPVDEAWYVDRYEDVASALRAGDIKSAHAHFVEHGYIEGRLPGPVTVDEQWYLEQYPDVAESVRRGIDASAQAHFDRDGYREGRLPFPL